MSLISNLKYLFICTVLASSSFAVAHESHESSDLIQDITEIKSIINDRIDEQALKFITDNNISEKKKKQCLKKLKSALDSSKKVKSVDSDKDSE